MPGAMTSGLGYYTEQAFLKQFPGETITGRTVNGKPVASFTKPGKLGTFFGQHMVSQAVEGGLFTQGVPPSGKTPATVQSITVTPKGGRTADIPRNATREQVDALIKTVERKRPKAQLPKAQLPKTAPDKPRGQPGAGGKAALLSDTAEDLTLGKPTLLGG